MSPRVWILVQGLTLFVLLAVIQGCSENATHCGFETPRCEGGKGLPPVPQYSGWRHQSECAQQVVNRLVRRDLIGPHIEYGQVDLDSKYRIRIFFRSRGDMRRILLASGQFWKFPHGNG